jgi:hypothetical protein
MLIWFSAAILLPCLFLLFFFFDCTTLHSPPGCSRGSDGNWVVMMLRADVTGSCLGRAPGVGRPPLRLSSMALMIEGPSSQGQRGARCHRSVRFSEDASTHKPRHHTENTLRSCASPLPLVLFEGPHFPSRAPTTSLPRVSSFGCCRQFQSSW